VGNPPRKPSGRFMSSGAGGVLSGGGAFNHVTRTRPFRHHVAQSLWLETFWRIKIVVLTTQTTHP